MKHSEGGKSKMCAGEGGGGNNQEKEISPL